MFSRSRVLGNPDFLKYSIFLFFVSLLPSLLPAQNCSYNSILAKYWQYRENFNKHFIVMDRDPSGCINDGIGQDSLNPCSFSKAGFGLPATSILQSSHGRWGMGERSDNDNFDPPIYDLDCMDTTSVGDGTEPGHKYNCLEMDSETLTQSGWYLVTLATEYELLGRNGQYEAQQRTLEEIFLVLQSIRRLDMQTQCLLDSMYQNRVNDTPNCLVCDTPYTITGGIFHGGNGHIHFDACVKSSCEFSPDFSGYNGFFIREDATQNLENYLHDSTSTTYNIDGVGSPFATSTPGLRDCTPIDQFCFMAATQNFISQDQVINLLYGMSFVKKFIPPTATVTTCDGKKWNIMDITKKLAESMVSAIDDNGNHIVVPGSKECTGKPVKISMSAGGNAEFTIHGMVKATEYITGKKRKSTLGQRFKFEVLLPVSEFNNIFYFRLKSIYTDYSSVNSINQNIFTNYLISKDKEIYVLGNDVLHPQGENLSDIVDFKAMLCSAPCGGPCTKDTSYERPRIGKPYYSPEFDCPNTPDWLGNRWATNDGNRPQRVNGFDPARRYNGLDFLSLFNLYTLNHPDGNFYNPNSGASGNLVIGDNGINGPSILCLNQSGIYNLIQNYSGSQISNITWESSLNLDVYSPLEDTTEVLNTALLHPSWLSVHFEETRNLVQNNNSGPTTDMVEDHCQINNKKEVISNNPVFTVVGDFSFCTGGYYSLYIEGTGNVESVIWTFKDFINNTSFQLSSVNSVNVTLPTNTWGISYGEIRAEIKSSCGVVTVTRTVEFSNCSNQNLGGATNGVLVFPNPVKSNMNVAFLDPNLSISAQGIPVRIYNANSGYLVRNTVVYSNISPVDITTLTDGQYNLQAIMPNGVSLITSFSIFRN